MDWQPIETAPKDGTWVLITGGDVTAAFLSSDPHDLSGGPVVVAYFDPAVNYGDDEKEEGGWLYAYWDSNWRSSFEAPTHWMPLPAPPAVSPD